MVDEINTFSLCSPPSFTVYNFTGQPLSAGLEVKPLLTQAPQPVVLSAWLCPTVQPPRDVGPSTDAVL